MSKMRIPETAFQINKITSVVGICKKKKSNLWHRERTMDFILRFIVLCIFSAYLLNFWGFMKTLVVSFILQKFEMKTNFWDGRFLQPFAYLMETLALFKFWMFFVVDCLMSKVPLFQLFVFYFFYSIQSAQYIGTNLSYIKKDSWTHGWLQIYSANFIRLISELKVLDKFILIASLMCLFMDADWE